MPTMKALYDRQGQVYAWLHKSTGRVMIERSAAEGSAQLRTRAAGGRQ
jgi:hypothetical protein